MAEIRIEGRPAGGILSPGDHLYLVFVDDFGSEFVIRGGPSSGLTGNPIKVEVGEPMIDSEDKRPISDRDARGSQVLDLGARDAADVWNVMLQQAEGIGAERMDYRVNSQNSNSLVASVLHAVGIDLADVTPDQPDNADWYPADGNQLIDHRRQLTGDEGIDTLVGGSIEDILIGGVGSDRLYGGDGDDFLFAGNRSDEEFEYTILPNGDIRLGESPYDWDSELEDNFSNWDDGEADYLEGGLGLDYYFVGATVAPEHGGGWDRDRTIKNSDWSFNENVYQYIDIVRDADGQGIVWYSLDGIGIQIEFRELRADTYTFDDKYIDGRERWGNILIDQYTDTESGITADRLVFFESETYHGLFAIDGFTNGDFGITLEGYTPGSIDALDDESTDSIDGTRGDDTINSYGGDDTIQGYAGADTIDGGTGFDTVLYSQSQGGVTVNLELGITLGGDAEGDVLISIENLTGSDFVDELIGNALSNTLLGGAGDDRLDGGLGDDFLDGGLGTDIFLWSIGMGNDLIVDSGDVGEGDTLRFGAGVLSSAVRLASNGTDLILTIGAEFISLIGYHVSTSVDFIAFDDGTVWDFAKVAELLSPADLNVIEAGDDGGYFTGTDGDDQFIGGAGDDYFAAGDGADIIDGGSGGYNQVDYIGAAADYLFTPNDDNTISVDDGSGEIDTLSNIDGIWFIGEDRWYSVDSLLVHSGINVIEAGDGGGYFTGSDGDDHFIGGAGDDTFSAGTGADIIDGGSGGYDQVDYAGAASDYTFIANDDGTISVDDGSGEIDTLSNIDGIWFVGESAWYNISALVTSVTGPYVIDGTAEDDLLFGSAGDDIMNGFAGLDTFIGSAGDDIINGGDDDYNQVNYNGARSDYLFSENDDGTVTATSDADGTDTLSDIGGIWFAADDAWYDMDNLIA